MRSRVIRRLRSLRPGTNCTPPRLRRGSAAIEKQAKVFDDKGGTPGGVTTVGASDRKHSCRNRAMENLQSFDGPSGSGECARPRNRYPPPAIDRGDGLWQYSVLDTDGEGRALRGDGAAQRVGSRYHGFLSGPSIGTPRSCQPPPRKKRLSGQAGSGQGNRMVLSRRPASTTSIPAAENCRQARFGTTPGASTVNSSELRIASSGPAGE